MEFFSSIDWMQMLRCFIVGGLICIIGQILIDKTKLTPARILVIFVTSGAILGGLGIYQYLVDFAGCGATVPLTGFGNALAKGAIDEVAKSGFVGAFIGGTKAASGGIAAAVFFRIYCISYFKTKNEKAIKKNGNLFFRSFLFFFINYSYTFFATSAIFVKAAGSVTAISASILRLIVTFAFFNPEINLLYVNPFILAAALILVIHNFLKSLFLSFLPT